MNDKKETPPKTNFLKGFLRKILSRKVIILHYALVGLLLFVLGWQVMNYYSYSTDYNIRNAVKTHHMVIYDLKTGETLSDMPSAAGPQVEEEPHTAETAAPVEEKPAEVAVILTNLGIDPTYTAEATALPASFIFSYSPYGTNPLDTSIAKAKDGGITMASVNYGGSGKFDITAANSIFKNTINAEAAISKIYDAEGVYISVSDTDAASEVFGAVASKLAEKQIMVVIPAQAAVHKHNIINADVVIKAATTPDAVNKQLAMLEELAKSDGYAIAVVEPQANIATILKTWAAGLKERKINLVPIIKN